MRKVLSVLILLGLISAWAQPAAGQGSRLSLIRDAEIEHIIRQYAEPIFQAAGINAASVDIYLVNDPRPNAFVAGGLNLFVTTGLLIQAKGADQLLGVIAHETGHMAGGHLARGQEQLENARKTAIISALLGVAAAVAAGDAGAGAAVISGGQQVAERTFLAYSRGMESAADQAATTYLDTLGYSAEGMLSFFEQLEDQEVLEQSRQTEYVRTHPLTRDRIDFIRRHVSLSPNSGQELPVRYHDWFDRIQAKLIGFLQPQAALQRMPDNGGIADRYGRAIARYRRGDLQGALAAIDSLLAAEPENPFFHELKGQMLLEGGDPAAARSSYVRAAELYPGESTILVPLAQTMLASGGPADLEAAVTHLRRAIASPRGATPLAWRLLATAYGRRGEMGLAAVALAEEALAKGDNETARQQADRAIRELPEGSAGWLLAQDVRRAAGG
ncbi:MAG: M48 family metalloprotease [Inquilinus sp.]|nr:M48 family metalloprotease [Inquilinus sp.]